MQREFLCILHVVFNDLSSLSRVQTVEKCLLRITLDGPFQSNIICVENGPSHDVTNARLSSLVAGDTYMTSALRGEGG